MSKILLNTFVSVVAAALLSPLATSASTATSTTTSDTTKLAPGIQVLSPAGGEQWQLGTSHYVSWTGAANAGGVEVWLMPNTTGVVPTEIVNVSGQIYSYQYPWSIPTTTAVGSYHILLKSYNLPPCAPPPPGIPPSCSPVYVDQGVSNNFSIVSSSVVKVAY